MILKFGYLRDGDDFYLNNIKHRKQREWGIKRYNAAIIDDDIITDNPFVRIDDNISVLLNRVLPKAILPPQDNVNLMRGPIDDEGID